MNKKYTYLSDPYGWAIYNTAGGVVDIYKVEDHARLTVGLTNTYWFKPPHNDVVEGEMLVVWKMMIKIMRERGMEV